MKKEILLMGRLFASAHRGKEKEDRYIRAQYVDQLYYSVDTKSFVLEDLADRIAGGKHAPVVFIQDDMVVLVVANKANEQSKTHFLDIKEGSLKRISTTIDWYARAESSDFAVFLLGSNPSIEQMVTAEIVKVSAEEGQRHINNSKKALTDEQRAVRLMLASVVIIVGLLGGSIISDKAVEISNAYQMKKMELTQEKNRIVAEKEEMARAIAIGQRVAAQVSKDWLKEFSEIKPSKLLIQNGEMVK